MQNTLTSMRTEIKIQNKVSINEELNKISMPTYITSIIKDNLRLADNGCNIITLDILKNTLPKEMKIKRQSINLLIKNLIVIFLKNISYSYLGIKI